MDENKILAPEAEQVARSVRAWLNSYTEKPADMVDYEYLVEEEGLALVTVQAAYKTREYILGGYEAQYKFGIAYRTTPTNVNDRMEADELLNKMATWAEANPIQLAAPCRTIRLKRDTNAALLAAYTNGAEDHQILMTLTYEVNV